MVIVWSNPIKIKISESGRTLGKKLYDDAVKRGTLEPSARENTVNSLNSTAVNEGPIQPQLIGMY